MADVSLSVGFQEFSYAYGAAQAQMMGTAPVKALAARIPGGSPGQRWVDGSAGYEIVEDSEIRQPVAHRFGADLES